MAKGKLFGALSKILRFVPVVGGPLSVAADVAGEGAKAGLFKKIGRIFKKRSQGGGSVLGNVVSGAVSAGKSAALASVGSDIGSIAHGMATTDTGMPESEFSKGFKGGFLKAWYEKNKQTVLGVGLLAVVGVVGLVLVRRA